jgi:pimeloyl-ACP methyl ester carboxylesterase
MPDPLPHPVPPPFGDDTVHYLMHVHDVRRGEATLEGYLPVLQQTSRGSVEMRYYPAAGDGAGAGRGAVFVGGAGGGFDTPVKGWLYPRLCEGLRDEGIAGLRDRYHHPNDLAECVLDVLAGISFLQADHVASVALVGHSFGGAVAIRAAALSPEVRTCVALSSQTHGAGPASSLGPRCSLLLAHGLADEILPPECSRQIYRTAREPKRLVLKENVRHGLNEWADELPGLLSQWIQTELTATP